MEEPWTILELAELAADALAAAQPSVVSTGAGASAEAGAPAGPRVGASGGSRTPSGAVRPAPAPARANGRVRDVPNERLVRWYVTVGLVDPPLSRRGRVARYGRRHLLQLVAVKRRQAEGRSLAEIQAELAGATDEALAAVARVPDTKPALQPAPAVLTAAPARFWTRSAAQLDPPAAEEPGVRDPAAAVGAGRALSAAYGDPADRGRSRLVHGVRLASGVTLLLEGAASEPGPEDVTAILNAARALLAELASRRLREPGPEHPADVPGPPPEVGSRT
ncbi:MAG TPA: MerR family transcriptional regulator [Streptosporangiaceae bacterium]|nr:MerR family transcriptional regulator [Streptosporangiaceae bacterium]